MPVQSTVIACPAGQWTSIAQYMELRRRLLVQCPINQLVQGGGVVNCASGIVQSFAGPNATRHHLVVSSPTPGFDVTIHPTNTVSATVGFRIQSAVAGNPIQSVFEADESWGQDLGNIWYAFNASAGTTSVTWRDSSINCTRLIFGTQTNTAQYTGPYGTVPVGMWASPDFLYGRDRLDLTDSDELVKQEWFVWPVALAGLSINVQVFQSFDLPAPRVIEDYATFDVGLPQLSKEGKIHLDNLRRRISAEQPDFSGAGEFRGGAERSVGPLGGTGLAGGGQ